VGCWRKLQKSLTVAMSVHELLNLQVICTNHIDYTCNALYKGSYLELSSLQSPHICNGRPKSRLSYLITNLMAGVHMSVMMRCPRLSNMNMNTFNMHTRSLRN
jgi:hypothetical protein